MKTDLVCHKKYHESSKMVYLCLEDICRATKRIGCAHCFLEEHEAHRKIKGKINLVSKKLLVEEFSNKLTDLDEILLVKKNL